MVLGRVVTRPLVAASLFTAPIVIWHVPALYEAALRNHNLHVLQHLETEDESVKQLAFADVILLNKTDLVSPAELDALEARIKRINAVAKIHRTKN